MRVSNSFSRWCARLFVLLAVSGIGMDAADARAAVFNRAWVLVESGRDGELREAQGALAVLGPEPRVLDLFASGLLLKAEGGRQKELEGLPLPRQWKHYVQGEMATRLSQARLAEIQFLECLKVDFEAWPCAIRAAEQGGKRWKQAPERVAFLIQRGAPGLGSLIRGTIAVRLGQFIEGQNQFRNAEMESASPEIGLWAQRSLSLSYVATAGHYQEAKLAIQRWERSAAVTGLMPERLEALEARATNCGFLRDIECARAASAEIRETYASLGMPLLLAGAYYMAARWEAMHGDLERAVEYKESELAIAWEHSSSCTLSNGLTSLSGMRRRQGRTQSAIGIAQAAKTAAMGCGNPVHEAFALRALETVHLELGEYETALKYGKASVRAFRRAGDERSAAAGEGNVAISLRQFGDLPGAKAALRSALRSAILSNNYGETERIHSSLGEIEVAAERPVAALWHLRTALRLNEKTQNTRFAIEESILLSQCLSLLGRRAEAIEAARRSLGLALLQNSPGETIPAMIAVARSGATGAEQLLREAEKQAKEQGLLQLQVEAQASLCLQSNETEWCESAIRGFEGLRSRIAKKELRSGFLDTRRPLMEQVLESLWFRRSEAGVDATRAFAILERMKARVLTERIQAKSGGGLASLQEAKEWSARGGVGLLHYVWTTKSIHAFLVSPKGSKWIRRVRSLEDEQAIGTLRGLSSGAPEAKALSSWQPSAGVLGRLLLQPLKAELRGVRDIVVIADGPLHEVPWDSLFIGGDRVALEEHNIVTAPSATAAIALGGAPMQVRPGVSSASLWAPNNEAPLPKAKEEAELVDQLWPGAQKSIGETATLERFAHAANGRNDFVYISGHAVDAGRDRNELAFAGGERAGSALIESLNFSGAAVVIAACRSGGGLARRGEGQQGLVQSFQIAGAKRVVFSRWDVQDADTYRLMKAFLMALSQGTPIAEALWKAKLGVWRERGSRPAYRSPYFWAGFTVAGGL